MYPNIGDKIKVELGFLALVLEICLYQKNIRIKWHNMGSKDNKILNPLEQWLVMNREKKMNK